MLLLGNEFSPGNREKERATRSRRSAIKEQTPAVVKQPPGRGKGVGDDIPELSRTPAGGFIPGREMSHISQRIPNGMPYNLGPCERVSSPW